MSLTEPTPQRTWLLLFAYWATCAVVTLPHHLPFFSPSAPSSTPAPSFLAAFAVLATLLNGALFWSRAGRGRRRFSLVAALAFPLANGVVETFAFFLAFDLGVAASEFLSAASTVHFAGGFLSFSLYSGLVHAKLWEPLVLPAVTRDFRAPLGPRGTVSMISSLSLMSFSWLVLHFLCGRSAWFLIVGLHVHADFGVAVAVYFPSPF